MAHRVVRHGEAEIKVRLSPGFALADQYELRAGLFFLLGLVPHSMTGAEIDEAWQQAKRKAGLGAYPSHQSGAEPQKGERGS